MHNHQPTSIDINGVVPGSGRCVIEQCDRPAPTGMLMCRPHWQQVPTQPKQDLLHTVGLWREGHIPTKQLRAAQWACINAVT